MRGNHHLLESDTLPLSGALSQKIPGEGEERREKEREEGEERREKEREEGEEREVESRRGGRSFLADIVEV